jgi:hypothetical protein
MDQFPVFAKIVADSFQSIVAGGKAFVVNVDGDALYQAYLAAFPEGTNPIYRQRTEHDCSCCKQFIRRAGAVVTIDGGGIKTVWDEAAETAPAPYRTVASVLRDMVRRVSVSDLFRVGTNERSFGNRTTRALIDDKAITFNHFYTGDIPSSYRVASPDQVRGDYRTTVQVFERGLVELSPEAVETVLGLIEAKALYRGEEHKPALVEFQKLQRQCLASANKALFVWANAGSRAARFRNTVIGTLVQDLSDGADLEYAVKGFETKVAPTNYKRTTALITPGMVKKAMETIVELGLEPALERRFATIRDISVNDVKWVDNDVRPKMRNGLEHTLLMAAAATKPAKLPESENISLDDFVANVLPTTTSLELLFKNELVGNLAAITAPVHPEPKQLFKWTNDFAWSYGGNVADSMLRQKVQSLGGRVDGVLRFSHMWNHEGRNASLMDLHVFMPGSSSHADGCHDMYPTGQRVGWNKRSDYLSGGAQDVDYTAAAPEGYVPVENITFPTMEKLKDGKYVFKIHNWSLRQPTKGGFRAEIEFGGRVFQYDHREPLRQREWVKLATATLKNGVFTIEHHHPVGTPSQEKWGLKTEEFVKVAAVTLSPNYWGDNAVGNKHTFFVVEGAKTDEPMRGFYNEFLHPRLEPHRKVFEVIGDKTKCEPTEGQLSGLGFSSTKKESFVVRAQQGKKQRIFNVQVGV